jgi:hypothetical protein
MDCHIGNDFAIMKGYNIIMDLSSRYIQKIEGLEDTYEFSMGFAPNE